MGHHSPVLRSYHSLQVALPGCSWTILTERTLIICILSCTFSPAEGSSLVRPPTRGLHPLIMFSLLIGYYNEARILDPVSLQTVQVLPNIPGSVTSFLAGRTYPNEGTAVMLPQSAPYTDPVTILICGGSNFGIALDNCVSLQPEVSNPTWTIERMVSSLDQFHGVERTHVRAFAICSLRSA